jgi:hypothetical protein
MNKSSHKIEDNRATAKTDNPFQQVSLYFAGSDQSINAGLKLRDFGFCAHIFQNRASLLESITDKKMIAGVMLQGADSEFFKQVKDVYKGPVFNLQTEKGALIEDLLSAIKTILKNQMRIDDLEVLTALRNINRFISGAYRKLLITGTAQSLAISSEYMQLFAEHPFVTINDCDSNHYPDDAIYVSKELLNQSLGRQSQWWQRYGAADALGRQRLHLITHESSLDAIEQRFNDGKVFEPLYANLVLSAVETDRLANYTLEELCVQSPGSMEPHIFFEEIPVDSDNVMCAPDARVDQMDDAPMPAAKKGFFGSLFKNKP